MYSATQLEWRIIKRTRHLCVRAPVYIDYINKPHSILYSQTLQFTFAMALELRIAFP